MNTLRMNDIGEKSDSKPAVHFHPESQGIVALVHVDKKGLGGAACSSMDEDKVIIASG